MRRGIRRWICLAAAWLLLPALAMADGLEMAEPIGGERAYPEGADAAAYTLRYQYPQFVAQSQADQAVNDFYLRLFEEAGDRELSPEAYIAPTEPGAPAGYEQISFQVTANTDAYLSVALSTKQFSGYVESERLSADVFARQGIYAGQPVSLSQVMGLEQEEGEVGPGGSYASQLVYKLVWKIIEEQQASRQKDYFEELTQEELRGALNPEKDFYIDMDGNLVFFVQSGAIAGDVEGILTYPFAMAELLTAVIE